MWILAKKKGKERSTQSTNGHTNFNVEIVDSNA